MGEVFFTMKKHTPVIGPTKLVFVKNRKRCVSPPTEDCEVPTTTPRTNEEDQGNNNFTGQGRGQERPQPRDSVPENRRRFQTLKDGPRPQPQAQGLPFN